MDDKEILEYVKANLGLTTDTRDDYLLRIIKGVKDELKGSGISPDGQSDYYVSEYENYVMDYAAWMYRARGGDMVLPEHLKFRRHNLYLRQKAKDV